VGPHETAAVAHPAKKRCQQDREK